MERPLSRSAGERALAVGEVQGTAGSGGPFQNNVILAKAGIHLSAVRAVDPWIPAFARMTGLARSPKSSTKIPTHATFSGLWHIGMQQSVIMIDLWQ